MRRPWGSSALACAAASAVNSGSSDIPLPCIRHELHAFMCDPAVIRTRTSHAMPVAKEQACAILAEFDQAQSELVGKAVILTNGKAGTVDNIWLDEFHGLRISIRGHEGKWPVSTIKLSQTEIEAASRARVTQL